MTQESPQFSAFEIHWSTKVEAVDLQKIRDYQAQGKSTAASVALNIRDEALQILASANPVGSLIEGLREAEIILAYFEPASSILVAEEPNSDVQDESGQELDEWFDQFSRGEVNLIRGQHPELTNRIDAEMISEKVNAGLLPGFLRNMSQTMPPPALVDFYADYAMRSLVRERRPGEFTDLHKEAIERGRQRFHQLYTAAIEAGLTD